MLYTQEIRSKFINYFSANDHEHVHSSPLIPFNDPTLMFVNSGMVQFKNVFTGLEKRPYLSATSSQKCVRAGGKHNDLENVGYTKRHHTFFEMLGNFSFGEYFKEKAIFYAWELLIKEFGIKREKLYVTVYHDDDEAYSYWKKIASLTDDRIIRIPTSDNFWSMGETGPCGPCSEVFYDHGDKVFGGLPGTKDQDGDRYVEIWNMVFMQYEQIDKNNRIELPQKCIDTGMGMERVAAVLQGKADNYDIDLFQELIACIEETIKTKATTENKPSFNIIADHLRSCSFLIADGVVPSNEGRGYVLRRIMRRSMRHINQLGYKEPAMHQLLPTLVHLMSDAYPELQRASNFIAEILKREEEKFQETLERGLKVLEENILSLDADSSKILSGDKAFKLYDTFGFPLDLTQDILKGKGISVDFDGFDAEMQKQKERAKASWISSGEAAHNEIWFEILQTHGVTEFLGYLFTSSEGVVNSIIADSSVVDSFKQKDKEFWLVANQTPFYAESGGQKGDIGYIYNEHFKAQVIDTQKFLGIHAHLCALISGEVKTNSSIKLEIDKDYRDNLRANHTSTHLLHAAVKNILGNHVAQKGSLVSQDRLRLDISYHEQISKGDITKIENQVFKVILENLEVTTRIMKKDDAMKEGAIALFGEKYDEEVRVVSVGEKNSAYSAELCGGTHVKRTGDIGFFKIISEKSIANGVRRIEAISGFSSLSYVQHSQELITTLSLLFKTNSSELESKISNLMLENKELIKQIADLRAQKSDIEFANKHITLAAKNIDIKYHIFKEEDIKILREVAQKYAQKYSKAVIVVVNKQEANFSIIIALSKNITTKGFSAKTIIQNLNSIFKNGRGGGSEFIAQSSFEDIKLLSNIEDVLLSQI